MAVHMAAPLVHMVAPLVHMVAPLVHMAAPLDLTADHHLIMVVMAVLATQQVLEALEEQFHLILELQIQQQQEDRVAQV
jgi:hypothetical protein